MRRASIPLLVAFFLAFLTMGADPAPPAGATPETDWSQVPAAVRRLLHMHVSAVPAYPKEGDSLIDVRRWPPTRVMDGKTYVLEFSASQSDVAMTDLKSLAEVPPGMDYGAHYVSYADSGIATRSLEEIMRRSRGPSYYWRSDSTLKERSYDTRDWNRLWQYARTGDLSRYSFKEYDSTLSARVSADEWFGAKGELIACRTQGKSYWMGVETDVDTFYWNLHREWRRIGWSRPPGGYALPPCSPPSGIVTQHWRPERLDPRFTFRMPAAFVSDSARPNQDELFRAWTDGKLRIQCQVGIWDTGPLRRSLSLNFSECVDTLDGVPFRLATTCSAESPQFYASAVSADSVLPFLGQFRTALSGTSPDSAGQHLLLAIIRTLKVDPAPSEERR